MKKYIKASLTSGMIGIWWLYHDVVIAGMKPLDEGYNDGSFIQYDQFKNHATEWSRLVREFLPDKADEIIPKGYKSLERGRVIYNLRTQSYEVTCSKKVNGQLEDHILLVDAFDLEGCRYDFVTLNHYYIAELTGNPALDAMEYGI